MPATFTVYGNAWLVERSGVVHELDAVVVGPHAVFVVEIKGYRGTIEGTDYDWYLPEPVKSPIEKNRKTAQILHGLMKRVSYEAGQLWTQGLVFLSATTRCNVRGPASKDRIHTRATIIAALTDPAFVDRIANRAYPHRHAPDREPPPPADTSRFTRADLDAALLHYNELRKRLERPRNAEHSQWAARRPLSVNVARPAWGHTASTAPTDHPHPSHTAIPQSPPRTPVTASHPSPVPVPGPAPRRCRVGRDRHAPPGYRLAVRRPRTSACRA